MNFPQNEQHAALCINPVLKTRNFCVIQSLYTSKGFYLVLLEEAETSSYNGGKGGCFGHTDLLKEF